MKPISRREFITKFLNASAGLALSPLVSACSDVAGNRSFSKKIVILGIDGLDPGLLEHYIREGVMPNFVRLMGYGSFSKMRSSTPPQSPVAWSDFTVGASAAVHGIYDFIHRDPKTMIPYFSTSQVLESKHSVKIGDWNIPLSGGEVRQLREGKAFWEYLEAAEIPATIYRMPGNFPAESRRAKCVSGMGTPDILGSYGTFSFYTTAPHAKHEQVTGGRVFPVTVRENKIISELIGPVNSLKKERPDIKLPLFVWIDPQNDVAKIQIQNCELMLTPGEWSDWIQVSFDYLPHVKSTKGICKIFLKQVRPEFEMYISPINIDPIEQALPVTSPTGYGKEIAKKIGTFGTKGLPADTKALSYGVLSDEEYLQLSRQILDEDQKVLQFEMDKLQSQSSGVLFFYFSNIDQDSHMFWRAMDRKHPLYSTSGIGRHTDVIRDLYVEMDRVLGNVYKTFDLKDDRFRLIVMSDHGFAPFYRGINLNTWLLRNGYTSLSHGGSEDDATFFKNVDWSKSKAYGLGINALYLNRQGRERNGIVSDQEGQRLMMKLSKELLDLKDPLTGANPVSRVWFGKNLFHREDDKVPDMIIGWNRGYRSSWETILGGFPPDVFVNNNDKWSGDHCIDPMLVPAVLLSNKRITLQDPSLHDITATILAECNLSIPKHMTGRPLYSI
jgi:predicted AlkP superfamily phosphohydrolase/phosphomutase